MYFNQNLSIYIGYFVFDCTIDADIEYEYIKE